METASLSRPRHQPAACLGFVVVLGPLCGYNDRHFVNRFLNPVDLEVP